MQSEVAADLLARMGQGSKLEGSISGAAVVDALARLEASLSEPEVLDSDPDDEEAEQEYVSLSARAAPLLEMLKHANSSASYVMWKPE